MNMDNSSANKPACKAFRPFQKFEVIAEEKRTLRTLTRLEAIIIMIVDKLKNTSSGSASWESHNNNNEINGGSDDRGNI